jgi:hypothetical protein
MATIVYALKIWKQLAWQQVWHLHWPEESEVLLHPIDAKFAAKDG